MLLNSDLVEYLEYLCSENEGINDKYVQALIDRTLFIKFLEDRHIINSYFYGKDIEYKKILESKSAEKVNELFKNVHKIFNNYLFEEPTIPNKILEDNKSKALEIIQNTIEGVENGQLTLFDFKFDIIPIEAISLIYEIFLNEKQRKDGIYYTPKQLTNLITEKTINKKGKIIDPACGSGAFLISAYKKLLKIDNKHFDFVKDKINYRINLIKECIFGIEKDPMARRLSVFSLYLSILDDLSQNENENLKELLKNEENYPLFIEDFGENIICSNTFENNKFDTEQFDFVIGNPPWKKDFEDKYALSYYNKNQDYFSGKRELSELFLHKAQIWENQNTRYGFVVNTSNFTNKYGDFQSFFYKKFNIENFYEVTNLRFFIKSKVTTPAIVCIYTGSRENTNKLNLNVLKANDFSHLFQPVFIIEDDGVEIEQNNLIKTDNKNNIPLRNFLVGKEGDFSIINYLESNKFEKFNNSILKNKNDKPFIGEGITVWGETAAKRKFGIKKEEWKILSKEIKEQKSIQFYSENIKNHSEGDFIIPYIKRKDISPFCINGNSGYLKEDRYILHRGRKDELFSGQRILLTRLKSKRISAVYVEDKIYSQDAIFTIKLIENKNPKLISAILNSRLIDFYSEIQTLKRIGGNYPRNNTDSIKEIPIPKHNNPEIVNKIEKLVRQIAKGKAKFSEKENELNNLIYSLYGVGIIEKQRINDFFIKEEKVQKQDLENYANEFCEYIIDNLKPDVELFKDSYNEDSLVKGISVVKIYFGKKGEEYPSSEKTGRFLLTDLLKDASKTNILTLRKRIYGENTIYIIKDSLKKNWTITKAGEDAIAELNEINKHNSKNK